MDDGDAISQFRKLKAARTSEAYKQRAAAPDLGPVRQQVAWLGYHVTRAADMLQVQQAGAPGAGLPAVVWLGKMAFQQQNVGKIHCCMAEPVRVRLRGVRARECLMCV